MKDKFWPLNVHIYENQGCMHVKEDGNSPVMLGKTNQLDFFGALIHIGIIWFKVTTHLK